MGVLCMTPAILIPNGGPTLWGPLGPVGHPLCEAQSAAVVCAFAEVVSVPPGPTTSREVRFPLGPPGGLQGQGEGVHAPPDLST